MTDELRNEAAEAAVRRVWNRVIVADGSYRHYAKGTILINWANHQFYDFPDYLTAETFTREKQKEARQIKEEINYQNMMLRLAGVATITLVRVVSRTITRLESALASARRGMKENA